MSSNQDNSINQISGFESAHEFTQFCSWFSINVNRIGIINQPKLARFIKILSRSPESPGQTFHQVPCLWNLTEAQIYEFQIFLEGLGMRLHSDARTVSTEIKNC